MVKLYFICLKKCSNIYLTSCARTPHYNAYVLYAICADITPHLSSISLSPGNIEHLISLIHHLSVYSARRESFYI